MQNLADLKAGTRSFVLYDSRACGSQGTEEASVLVCCESNREAKSYKADFGAMACYSYRVDGKNLVDEQWEWDWYPSQKDWHE